MAMGLRRLVRLNVVINGLLLLWWVVWLLAGGTALVAAPLLAVVLWCLYVNARLLTRARAVSHSCLFEPDTPPGALWRCPGCEQLWQLSVARGHWVEVSDEDAALLRNLGFDV